MTDQFGQNKQLHLDLIQEANRAPSVHNVQPALWKFQADGRVQLFGNPKRRLTVGDLSGNDHRVSLGASFEGMRLALVRRGYLLSDVKVNRDSDQPIAEAKVIQDSNKDAKDPLCEQVGHRATWRGKFQPASIKQMESLRNLSEKNSNLFLIENKANVKRMADLADQASFEFTQNAAYQKELFSWMRFSKKHPRWSLDGLNADAMALSPAERQVGEYLMNPSRFRKLIKVGLAKALVSESSKTTTASGLLVLTTPDTMDPFLFGQEFYRVWLELCSFGFSACPMSALADSQSASAQLCQELSVAPDYKIMNVLRVGIAPPSAQNRLSARLPAEAILHT